MFPLPIQKLIRHFQKLPGIGPRQAAKFALRLTKMTESEVQAIAADMASLKSSVSECRECFLLFDRPATNGVSLCQFCRDDRRDRDKICVVASDHDALAIEKTKTFDGLYHILGGYVSLTSKKDNLELNLAALKNRLIQKNGANPEVILAFNATTDGQATALYLEKFLQGLPVKTTRLAQGLSTGSEIEYADDQTLISALKHRR